MLLTFLGLTMAATTSTELQIATNYRWSQQALYNAEAGLEAARVVLANVSTASNGWLGVLPTKRTTEWAAGAAPAPGLLVNDLERVVLPAFPAIAELKRLLLAAGAGAAVMSGSGSAVVGLAASADEAARIAADLGGRRPEVAVHALRTVAAAPVDAPADPA
jgi:hypothetical protein